MFRQTGEAPERAARVTSILEAAGHRIGKHSASGTPASLWHTLRESPDVIHSVGSGALQRAVLASRLTGAAVVHEPLRGDPEPGARDRRAIRAVATGPRGGAVLARDEAQAARVRAESGLPYLPPVIGELAESAPGIAVLLAVYDRLPRLNPGTPDAGAGGRAGRRRVQDLAEPVRRGALRHPGALLAYLRGRRLRAGGRPREAAEALARAGRGDGDNPLYELHLVRALRESGERDRAMERLSALAARVGDDDPRLLGEVGVELARLGLEQQARDVVRRLERAGEKGSDSADASAEAAQVCVALGDLRSARELARRAAAMASDRSPAQRTAALALEQAGEPSEALELAHRSGERGQERRLAGLLRELGPGWIPRLPAAAEDRRADSSRVLVLLEVSLPQAPSGYAYRSLELLAALRRDGFEPVAATRLGFPASRGIREWSPVEIVDNVVHHRFNVPGLRQYSGLPLDLRVQENAESLIDLVRRMAPAAIVAATPELNGVVALALRSATGTSMVYDVRGFPEMSWASQAGGSESELYRKRREAETSCASEADAVITLSETMRWELAGRGVDAGRIFTVPQIVDTGRYTPRPRDETLAHSYGIAGKLVVGSVTSLTDYEGIDTLLRAVALARAERPEVAALIVGDGPERHGLEALADELGIRDSVAFAGRLDQERVPAHYGLLDLFAIPRHDLEVCRAVTPLKPFEALAMGVPVLASDLPALNEIVSDSSGGRLVTPGSAEALAAAILELGANPAERERLGRNGRDHVLAHNTPEHASLALRAALDGVLVKN